jgi:hypothetical protein
MCIELMRLRRYQSPVPEVRIEVRSMGAEVVLVAEVRSGVRGELG